jgi:glyoxylase-like metal-dependent hydrolase (beta-lactamase superfamily II)
MTGNDIKDIKAVIMGHMHLDHAGGLEHFRGTDVPIYIHELELKHAFFAVASKSDFGSCISSTAIILIRRETNKQAN